MDNDASDGNRVSLAIAALAYGIGQQRVLFNVASDALQLMARVEYNQGSVCPTEPVRSLIPIFLSGEAGDCGSEAYGEEIPEPVVTSADLKEWDKQHKEPRPKKTSHDANAKNLPSKPQVSAKAEESL